MADYDLKYTGAQIDGLLDAANELKTNGYIYKGVATPSTNPGTPTERVAYLASEPGTYTNFGGIVIASGLYSLTYAGGTWTGTQMQAGSDIEVVQTTGQSASDVMSQKAVTDEIENMPTISNVEGIDFAIVDEQGYGIVLFEDGHLRTKNFNSKNAVVNSLPYLSQTKKYTKQVDEDFVFENVGLIGNWVKRTFNNVSVASSYSWGAEILFAVRGTTSVVANFIIDSSVDAPSISFNVDDGEWTTTTASASLTLANNLNVYTHTIRIRVASCTLNENIYTQGAGALNFAGLSVDANANVMPLSVTNKKCLFIGDSITGGVGSSVWQGYSYVLSDMLNMQTIQCALAGGGLVHGSRTYLPTAAQVLREMISGAYNAVNTPDIIFINLGTNDGSQTPSATFVTGYHNLIAYIRKRFGGCHIYACAPFNGVHKNDVESAIEGFDNITYIDTTALVGTYTTSDGTHPDVAGAKTCADFCYDKIIETINLNYFN